MRPPALLFRLPLRDSALALAVGLLAAAWLSWQALGMPLDVSQFPKYLAAARSTSAEGADPVRTLDFSPAYLAVSRAAAAGLADPERGLALAQVAWSAAAVALLFLLLRRHVGTGLALVGAGACAFDRSLAVYTYVFEPEPLVLFALVACLFFAGARGARAAAVAGAALALAFLARPSFLPLAVLVPAAWRAREGSWRAVRPAAGLFLLPVAAALAFLAVRNHALTGSFSPVVMNPGTVFFDGNNPLSRGYAVAYPPLVNDLALAAAAEVDYQHAAYRRLAQLESGLPLSPAGANAFWASKAAAFVRDEPGTFLRRVARKALWALHAHRWHDLRAAWLADRALGERGFPATPVALLSALAAAGCALGIPRWRELLPLYGALALQGAVVLGTYASARQRLAIVPLLCVFAAIGAGRLLAPWRGRGSRLRAAAAIVGVGVLAWPLAREGDLMRDYDAGWEAMEAAQRHAAAAAAGAARGDRDAAVREAAAALAFSPWAGADVVPPGIDAAPGELVGAALERHRALRGDGPSARFDRALLLQMDDRGEEAAPLLRQLLREGREFERLPARVAEPRYHLARIALRQGRSDEAVRLCREALESAPGDPSVLALLAAITGEPAPAERLRRYFDALDARLFLGRALLAAGRGEDAARELRTLADALPDYRPARDLLEQARAGQPPLPRRRRSGNQ